MAHRTRLRANMAAWALNSAVLQSEFEAFDAAQFSSPDFDAGGIWLPSGKILIGGTQGIDMLAPFRSLGTSCFLAATQAQNWPERASYHNAGDHASPNMNLGFAWSPDIVSGGRYVAINPSNSAGCNSQSSEDGTQWSFGGLLSAAAETNPCVAAGRINAGSVPGFVMTWTNPTGLYTSLNGLAWGTVSATLPANGVAVYSPTLGLWVIAGDAGVLYTSPTTLAGSWTARTTPAGWQAGCGGVKRAVFANGLFVILPLAAYGKVLTSPDGVTWTEHAIGSTQVWTGIAYSAADGLWMLIAGSTAIATSPDTITWTVFNHSLALANDLTVINSLWVATTLNGGSGGVIWSVDKGANWQGVAVGNHRVATAGWKRIVAADNRFAAIHTDGASVEVALSLRSS